MLYEINKLNPSDYPKCANIWNMEKQPLTQKWLDEIVAGRRVVYVYTENGEFLGEGALVFEANEPDYTIPHKRIYLSRMVVKHSERGRGIGGILLDYLCDIAREMGYSEMTLGVDTDNHAARRLYEKKGFTTLLYQGVDQYGEYVKLLKRLTAARE